MAAKVTVNANGPIKVEGEFELLDGGGKPFETSKKALFLCRCGQTKNSPLCDGSHSATGFTSPSESREL